MKFEAYRITAAIKDNLAKAGFRRPTDIQFKAIPAILNGEDVLAIAQTGTGKTAAFAIPVLHLLHERKRPDNQTGIRCVVLEPTRELALQVTETFLSLGANTRVKVLSVFGGVDQTPQINQLTLGVDVLVATPGRMFDLISQGYITLTHTEIVVLDEADHMLDLGFIQDIRDLIKHLPRKRQTLFFSATINEKIKKLAYSLVNNPIRIQLSPQDPVSKNVSHGVLFVEMEDKRFFLERIIVDNPGKKILVFVRTKVRAERVASAMHRVNIASTTIHGSKDQEDRLSALQQFKAGTVPLLIATDVSARGIDIPGVDVVVNYDLPDKPENYVHRVGRTGRGTHKGRAISLCSTDEYPTLQIIEEFLTNPIQILQLSRKEYEETLQLSEQPTPGWNQILKAIEENEQSRSLLKKKRKK
jgi:ATP-dependent RNA helicase RhlE